MDVVGVDERTGRQEIAFPAYRVCFCDSTYGALSSSTTYTYELAGAPRAT
jgi:hypothetical protein